MASDRTGEVGRMTDAFGTEVVFYEVQGRVTIDVADGLVLDAGHREEFQRYFMEAERRAEARAKERVGTCTKAFIPSEGDHTCGCDEPADHLKRGAPHICPDCGVAWRLDSERRMCATPGDCVNGPDAHPVIPEDGGRDTLPCCRQPWEERGETQAQTP